MSLREELDYVIGRRREYNDAETGCHWDAFASAAYRLIRDHGQALLDALEDGGRLDWLFKQWSGEALRNIGVVYSEPSEYRQAIDAARSKITDQAIDAAIKGDG